MSALYNTTYLPYISSKTIVHFLLSYNNQILYCDRQNTFHCNIGLDIKKLRFWYSFFQFYLEWYFNLEHRKRWFYKIFRRKGYETVKTVHVSHLKVMCLTLDSYPVESQWVLLIHVHVQTCRITLSVSVPLSLWSPVSARPWDPQDLTQKATPWWPLLLNWSILSGPTS